MGRRWRTPENSDSGGVGVIVTVSVGSNDSDLSRGDRDADDEDGGTEGSNDGADGVGTETCSSEGGGPLVAQQLGLGLGVDAVNCNKMQAGGDVCFKAKGTAPSYKGQSNTQDEFFLEIIYSDLVGPIISSASGSKFL